MSIKRKIMNVVVCHKYDDCPDTSTLGEYTDNLEIGVIVRRDNEFYELLPKDNDGDFIEPLPKRGREFRGFKPYAGGEKVGSEEYYKYGMQDYERMELLNNGHWQYIGIVAIAEVGISNDNGLSWHIDELTSSGLWGIESDSGKDYIKEIEDIELSNLSNTLQAYGFSNHMISKAFENIEHKDE